MGLPTARRELRQAREGATVTESECGRPFPILLRQLALPRRGDKPKQHTRSTDLGTARKFGHRKEVRRGRFFKRRPRGADMSGPMRQANSPRHAAEPVARSTKRIPFRRLQSFKRVPSPLPGVEHILSPLHFDATQASTQQLQPTPTPTKTPPRVFLPSQPPRAPLPQRRQRLLQVALLLLLTTLASALCAQTPHAKSAAQGAAQIAKPSDAFPYLPGESRSQALSIGDTSHGYLVAARKLVPSKSLGILPRQRKRKLNYGSDALVAALENAARSLYKKNGTKLWLGNLSQRQGGDIRWSVSHNSGRDADIAFCYQDRKGKPVVPPDLVRLNGQGLAPGRGWRLDVAATWTVIAALLSDRRIQVQYLFISGPLRNLLLMHARKQGASASLLTKAAIVLRQPAASSPHNDHLHLRIYCNQADVLAGCVNTGAMHPKTREHHAAKRAFVATVAKHSRAKKAIDRSHALRRLVLLSARDQVGSVKERLRDPSRRVRSAAATALAALADSDDLEALIDAYRNENDNAVRLAQVAAVGRLGGPEAGAFLRSEIARPDHDFGAWWQTLERQARARGSAWLLEGLSALPRTLLGQSAIFETPVAKQLLRRRKERLDQRLARVAAAKEALRLEPTPRLIGLLSDPSPSLRQAAAEALREITNLSYFVRWRRDPIAKRKKGIQRWRRAWRRGRGAPRNAWLLTGFQGAGYKIKHLDRSYSWELVRAIHDGKHLARNAQRILMRLLKHSARSLSWGRRDACQYWLRFVNRRRRSLKLQKADRSVQRACNRAPAN